MKKQKANETEGAPPSNFFIRTCMVCGQVMEEPLKVDGRLYRFYSLAHKEQWDLERRIFRVPEKVEAEPYTGEGE